MFTGLIETTGTVLAVEQREGSRRLAVALPIGHGVALRTGDSIAVSGVCLTALDIEPGRFHADLAAETVARTSLSLLTPGSTVNLELPTPAGAPLGGHVVQGHVDGMGTVRAIRPDGFSRVLEIDLETRLARYLVEKGSVAVDGIASTACETGCATLSVV